MFLGKGIETSFNWNWIELKFDQDLLNTQILPSNWSDLKMSTWHCVGRGYCSYVCGNVQPNMFFLLNIGEVVSFVMINWMLNKSCWLYWGTLDLKFCKPGSLLPWAMIPWEVVHFCNNFSTGFAESNFLHFPGHNPHSSSSHFAKLNWGLHILFTRKPAEKCQ